MNDMYLFGACAGFSTYRKIKGVYKEEINALA